MTRPLPRIVVPTRTCLLLPLGTLLLFLSSIRYQAHGLTFFDENFEGTHDNNNNINNAIWTDDQVVLRRGGQGKGGKTNTSKDTTATAGSTDDRIVISTSALTTPSPTIPSLTLDDMPKKCSRLFSKLEPFAPECLAWFAAHNIPIPSLPTAAPTTYSPTPFFDSEIVTFANNDGDDNIATTTTIRLTLAPMDDTFIEQWRPDYPLGGKEKLKIDSMDGLPTKIIMLKFALGNALKTLQQQPQQQATLVSAKLRLFAITNTTFGGWVQEMDTDWDEDTAIWNDYVSGGKNGMHPEYLLPLSDDNEAGILSEFGDVRAGQWFETELWGRLTDVFGDGGNGGGVSGAAGNQLGLRITTNSTDGVIYTSKEYMDGKKGPELILEFVLGVAGDAGSSSGSAEDGVDTGVDAVNENNATEIIEVNGADVTIAPTTIAPAASTSKAEEDETNEPSVSPSSLDPTLPPTANPVVTVTTTTAAADAASSAATTTMAVVSTASPVSAPLVTTDKPTSAPVEVPSPINPPTLAPVEPVPATMTPISEPNISASNTVAPTPKPTDSPIATQTTEELSSSTTTKTTSIVSSSYRMTISAIEPKSNSDRNLRSSSSSSKKKRDLSAFMSIDEKERPAIKQHLQGVYKDVLSSAPEDISLAFEDEVVVEMLETSEEDDGGVLRISTFRVIGIFNSSIVKGLPTAGLATILDQATLYAFVGAEKEEFITILENTGEPILSSSAEHDVTVSKVKFSVGSVADTVGKVDSFNAGATAAEEEEGSTTSSWVQPALISGAALLVAATSGAALILLRQRRADQNHSDNRKPIADSPRSAADTVPGTPSPGVFITSWKKKRFDYAEFEDDPDVEDPSAISVGPASPPPTTAKYFSSTTPNNRPHDIKFSQFMNTSFDDSSVSDVSAHIGGHILGAKGMKKSGEGANRDDQSTSQAESFLLDTTMDSYNMEAMSALEQVRFENVLQIEDSPSRDIPSHPPKFTNEDESLSIGDVPSELYSNLSMDSSALQSHDTGAYGGHLFAFDMVRNKDSSMFVMPPPPSDAASDASSQQDAKHLYDENDCNSEIDEEKVEDDLFEESPTSYPIAGNVERNNHLAPVGIYHSEHDEVSQSINDELSKVMELLRTPTKADETEFLDVDETHNIPGYPSNDITREIHNDVPTSKETSTTRVEEGYNIPSIDADKPPVVDDTYDGMNILVDDVSTDAEPDEDNPLKLMNSTLSDCMDILDKVRPNRSPAPYSNTNE